MINFNRGIIALLGAALLDYLIADPRHWIHPVQVMGWGITHLTQWILTYCPHKWPRRLGGILLGLTIIIGSGIIGWLIINLASRLDPLLGLLLEIILLASCFAGKGLRLAAQTVILPLTAENIDLARGKLSQYVGRDTAHLSAAEIQRALLETIAENAVDGVTAPLFYAIFGLFLPMGSVPLALGYKAASTLDSMVGYRREPYTEIGWFSAQLEDRLTWLPCRLTVITLALLSGKLRQILALCYRDAAQDPSPNSGWSESVYAAILGVQLGGENTYQGVVKAKPLLGDSLRSITPDIINQALNLTRMVCLVWLSLLSIISFLFFLCLN